MPAILEHANFTVTDPKATAAWMSELFGWSVRWSGEAMMGGFTIHVGTQDHYVALYSPGNTTPMPEDRYQSVGALNHIGITVDDLDATESAVLAHGFKTSNHGDYEPGRRFYFHDSDGIEYEVVSYK